MQTSAPSADPNLQAEILEALQDLRAEVMALSADIRAYGVMRADATQAELVGAIHAANPCKIFLASELLAVALRDDPAARRLAMLLVDMSPRAVGKTLSAASNKVTDAGLVLRRVDDCNAGALWCVTRV